MEVSTKPGAIQRSPMKVTYTVNNGMYIYHGPRGYSGIAYSLEKIDEVLTRTYGTGNYELIEVCPSSTTSA